MRVPWKRWAVFGLIGSLSFLIVFLARDRPGRSEAEIDERLTIKEESSIRALSEPAKASVPNPSENNPSGVSDLGSTISRLIDQVGGDLNETGRVLLQQSVITLTRIEIEKRKHTNLNSLAFMSGLQQRVFIDDFAYAVYASGSGDCCERVRLYTNFVAPAVQRLSNVGQYESQRIDFSQHDPASNLTSRRDQISSSGSRATTRPTVGSPLERSYRDIVAAHPSLTNVYQTLALLANEDPYSSGLFGDGVFFVLLGSSLSSLIQDQEKVFWHSNAQWTQRTSADPAKVEVLLKALEEARDRAISEYRDLSNSVSRIFMNRFTERHGINGEAAVTQIRALDLPKGLVFPWEMPCPVARTDR